MAKYKIEKKIGKGGNGTVYKVKDSNGNFYAKKILNHTSSKKAYQRFKDEVKVLYGLNHRNGVVDIIDSNLPEINSKTNKAFYVMPLAISLRDYIKDKDDEVIIKIILDLCDTLEFLHSKDITHRDIKPDNILIINDKPVFSDFGLSNFPKKEKVSNPNENIGPKWTIAPEMKRISSIAEFKKADIYSFSKTIWMILTKKWKSFDGQYIPNSNISLNNFIKIVINEMRLADEWNYESIVLLERLLVDSTNNEPAKRPSAKEFKEKLMYWYDTNLNFFERNPYEWEDALLKMFPISIPHSCSWSNTNEIYNILKILFEHYDNLNYSFYPMRGGMSLTKIEIDKENNCLIINENGIIYPEQLIFESMNNLDWSYFRLELKEIKPLYPENVYKSEETLYIDNNGDCHQYNYDNFELYSKFINGSFLIVKKTSFINKLKGKYDGSNGLHSTRSNEEYKELLLEIIE